MIKGQYNDEGIPKYTTSDLTLPGYCPTNFASFEVNPETGLTEIAFNDQGPVYGPNGQLELDPENGYCPCKPDLVNIFFKDDKILFE